MLTRIAADIKALTVSSPDIVSELSPAFEKYNEEQLVTVKLPGSSQPVRNERKYTAKSSNLTQALR